LRFDLPPDLSFHRPVDIASVPSRGYAASEVETGLSMKELIAAVSIAALFACQASAAERHSPTPHRFNFQPPSSGGVYESTSQGHQSYPNPDRQPYVTQFDRPAS
jgi:hypothetical protein